MKKTISILGAGWLGLDLAHHIRKYFDITLSCRSLEKVNSLKSQNFQVEQVDLSTGIFGNNSFYTSDIFFINTPPSKHKDYLEEMKTLIEKISPKSRIIFISSTSLFSDSQEVVDEDSIEIPSSKNGEKILQVENYLKRRGHSVCIRFGGLIGEDRHPGKHLSAKVINSPYSFINLIHKEDCLSIIHSILNSEDFEGKINAVSPYHPQKIEFYTQYALRNKIALPIIGKNKIKNGKIVKSCRLYKELNYEFKNEFLF